MPGGGFPDHPHDTMEIVTIVHSGELSHRDSMGNEAVIKPGMVQRMSAGAGVVHSEFNRSTDPCHLYQLWFFPNEKTTAGYEEKALPTESSGLTVLASSGGREGSTTLNADATIKCSDLILVRYTHASRECRVLYICHER